MARQSHHRIAPQTPYEQAIEAITTNMAYLGWSRLPLDLRRAAHLQRPRTYRHPANEAPGPRMEAQKRVQDADEHANWLVYLARIRTCVRVFSNSLREGGLPDYVVLAVLGKGVTAEFGEGSLKFLGQLGQLVQAATGARSKPEVQGERWRTLLDGRLAEIDCLPAEGEGET